MTTSVPSKIETRAIDGGRQDRLGRAMGVAEEIALQAVRETAKEGRKRNAMLSRTSDVAPKSGQDASPSDLVQRDIQSEVPGERAQL